MDQKLKRINLILKVFISLVGLGFFIAHLVDNIAFEKTWSYVATVGVAFVPDFLRLFKINLSARLEFFYLLYLIPALILGINCNWYRDVPFFDKANHALSGVLAALVADQAITASIKHPDPRFKLLFLVSFVALTAVAWEGFEFIYDLLFDGNMQELTSIGLHDTMWDMLAALTAGTLTSLPLIKH